MTASRRPPAGASPASCPFCGVELQGGPDTCPRCGTLLGSAADAARREGERRRSEVVRAKNVADAFFLAGLLLGGPLITHAGRTRLGLFFVLGGGLASVARRYTAWSTPGTLLVGALTAAVVTAAVVEPPAPAVGTETARSRQAFVEALATRMIPEGIHVEARGPEGTAVWFHVPGGEADCGNVPGDPVRAHLGDLGVRRVVVTSVDAEGRICTFRP